MSQVPIFSVMSHSLSLLNRSLLTVGVKQTASIPRVYSSVKSHSRLLSTAPAADKKPESRASSTPKNESSSLVMNLFSGTLRADLIFPYPDVLTEDNHEILEMVRTSTQKLYESSDFDPLKSEEREAYTPEHLELVKSMGGFGLMVPAEYGGAGLNNTQFARMGELGGETDLAFGIVLGAHQSIGYKGIILFGNQEQKDKYLPDLATGKKMAAFALTEPSSGSDASSIQTRAELSPDGKHYILNGSKVWISNGGIADVMTVFAKTPVKEEDGTVKDKVTAFIVERAFGGVTSGPPEKKMGIKASNTASVFFDNCKVPIENVLGGVGGGFKVAMNILNSGRFGMQAALTGTMKKCISIAVEHAKNRKQFGDKLANFGTIQEKIARMSMAHYTTETLAYLISGLMDQGVTEYQLEAAIGKVVASESAWFVADESLQILGGMGFMKGTVEKFVRDIRIFRIFEGTNEILRLFVALTGLQAAGSHLKELQRALNNPMSNIGVILDEGTKRVLKSVGLGSSVANLNEKVAPELRNYSALAARAVDSFGSAVEHLLRKYNKDIIHEQFLLNRLSNSAIDIFIMMVVLSRATRAVNKNLPSAQHEVNLASVICSEAAERIQYNLTALRSNPSLNNFKLMKNIANTVFEADGVAQRHPIDRV